MSHRTRRYRVGLFSAAAAASLLAVSSLAMAQDAAVTGGASANVKASSSIKHSSQAASKKVTGKLVNLVQYVTQTQGDQDQSAADPPGSAGGSSAGAAKHHSNMESQHANVHVLTLVVESPSGITHALTGGKKLYILGFDKNGNAGQADFAGAKQRIGKQVTIQGRVAQKDSISVLMVGKISPATSSK